MFTSLKTDRVVWQVTDTTRVPILGRTQAKLMNYVSYPKIHPPQEQSPVSQDSLKSTDYVHSLKTTNHSLQSTKTAQSIDSLKTTPKTDQTAACADRHVWCVLMAGAYFLQLYFMH